MEGKRILVIAPHPDDAEIAAFGLYSHKDTYIVTVTAGEAGDKTYRNIYKDEAEHYIKKGEIRTMDSLMVPLLGGIPPERSVNLGFFDATLKSLSDDRSSIAIGEYTKTSDINTYRKFNVSSLSAGLGGINNWDSLVKNIVYLLGEIKPDIIVAPFPAFDAHEDHQYSFHALAEALKITGNTDGHLMLYTNHFILNELYPYGEPGGAMSLPANFGDEYSFTKIYSHPMSEKMQRDKAIALNGMSDLRLFDGFNTLKASIDRAKGALKAYMLSKDESYFRRAVRSNELFYVLEIKDIYDDEKLSKLR